MRTLRQKIQGMLYERTAISRKPEELARQELEALQDEDKRFFFPARIMWSIYAHTLNRIVASDYNVFERRISISRFLKLLITFRYWLSHQLKYSWLKRGPWWQRPSTANPS